MNVQIDIDCSEIARELSVAKDQIPFAISTAINDVAWKARDKLRADLPSHLTLRNKFTVSGVMVDKGDKKNLEARVGELDNRWYMASHALGDEARHPPKGVVHIAAKPGDSAEHGGSWSDGGTDDGAPRPAGNKTIPRGLRIDRIDKSKHGGISYFVFRKGEQAIGMFYRSGAERPARRQTMHGQPVKGLVRPRLPVSKAYTFADEVRVRKDWPMEAIVAAVVEKEWPDIVQKAVIKALWSAK